MSIASKFRHALPAWAWALVLAGSATLAFAQLGAGNLPRPRLEYHKQEVPASTFVTTVNDLDGQGWEVFQVVPVWTLERGNDEQTKLVPQSYEVFARRPLKPGK